MLLDLFADKPVIEFYCRKEHEETLPEPVPAFKKIAEWWKRLPQTDTHRRDHHGSKAMTAKKCMPLLDAMSYGYIIPLQGDASIITNSDKSIIKVETSRARKVIEFHEMFQIGGRGAPGYPTKPLKFINYWCIKTAPGWSTLFLPLINHFDLPFTCFGGLVDTDTYTKEINFPAVWNVPDFDATLSAGTPLVVAIPVKRSIMSNRAPIRKITDKETRWIEKAEKIQQTKASYYTDDLRESRK